MSKQWNRNRNGNGNNGPRTGMTIPDALSILGNPEPGRESVMRAYRVMAKRYHPDLGGDLELMILVNLALEVLRAVDYQWTTQDSDTGRRTRPLTEKLNELWESVRHYRGIHGEVIGYWLWVTGETYAIRGELKAIGFRFSHLKRAWYYHEGRYWKHSKRKFSMGDIRAMWGTEDLETEEAQAVT